MLNYSVAELRFNRNVSNNIPRMLDGIVIPVSHTINSPTARHPMMIANCLNIFILNTYN